MMKTFEMLKKRQRAARVESIGGNGRIAQEAVWELVALTEVFGWFDLLVQNLGSPTRFVDMMVMNMVTSPYTQYGTGEDYTDEPGLEWMLINRALFNRMVWEFMHEHGLVQKVRRVLRRSIRRPDNVLSGVACGRFASKVHEQDLLDHFVKARPSTYWVL